MTNIIDNILGKQHSGAIQEISRHLGISTEQTQGIASHIIPMLMQGFSGNISNGMQGNGIESLLSLLQSPNSNTQDYAANPQMLQQPETVQNGNSILSQIFGTKDVSRQAADHTAQATGVGSSIIKKALPLLAVLAFNALKNHAENSASTMPATNTEGQAVPVQPSGMVDRLMEFMGNGTQVNPTLSNFLNAIK